MAEIRVIQGDDNGLAWRLSQAQTAIGRSPTCQIPLTDKRVSRNHCRIDFLNGRFVLTNLSMTNGTCVGGERINERVLADGDEIEIGESVLKFVETSADDEEELVAGAPGAIDTSASFVFLEDAVGASAPPSIDIKYDSRVAEAETITDFAQALEHLNALNRRFDIIRAVGESVVSELDLDQVLDRILNQVFQFVPAERGCVLLYDRTAGECVPRAVKERDRERPTEEMPMSRTILRTVLQERVTVLSTDALQDQRFAAEASIIMKGIRSVMAAPMLFQDEILGIIGVDSRSLVNAFSRKDLETLSIIANLAAMAIRNAEMLQERVRAETTRQNFARFLPPALVRQITEQGRELRLGGEAADVTILFTDIRAFTPLCERKPPEEIVRILNTCFQAWTECIFRHGGTLDKYIGDAVLAVFGSPEPYPDHSLRAARAAIEIRDSLNAYGPLADEIRVGTGLHRGVVIHGLVGSKSRMQYTVIGDTVNTAARLSKVAKGHQVVASKSVVDAERGSLLVQPLPPAFVPGKAEPIECYDLLAVLDEGPSTAALTPAPS